MMLYAANRAEPEGNRRESEDKTKPSLGRGAKGLQEEERHDSGRHTDVKATREKEQERDHARALRQECGKKCRRCD